MPVSQSIRVPYTSNVTHLMSFGNAMNSSWGSLLPRDSRQGSMPMPRRPPPRARGAIESRAAHGPARVPGQAALRPPRRPRPRRAAGENRRGGGRRRRGDRLPRAWSRPRSRSAAAARPAASRSPRTRREAEEHADGDPRHGHPRAHRPRAVDRGGLGHRRRVLRLDHLRPLARRRRSCMLSTQGGMDIEAVADEDPDAIARLHVDPLLGFQDFHGRRLAYEAGVDADVVRPIGALLAQALRRVHRRGGDARRGQPADRHRGSRRDGARRQGHARRQLALPPPRQRRAAQPVRPRTRRSRWPRSAA